jgi:hypothetical protein
LRIAYEGLHPYLSAKFGEPHDPKDFEEALRILEGGFVSLRGGDVHFVNPSLRDFLGAYLADPILLRDFALASCQPSWAKAVWEHGRWLKLSDEEVQPFALCFVRIAELFVDLTTWERVEGGHTPSVTALSNTDRIELLLDWWNASHDERFTDLALALARAPVDGLSPWLDGREAIGLLGKLRDGDYFYGLPCASEMADSIEEAVLDMIDQCFADDLENISDATEEWRHVLGERIWNAVERAIRAEIDQVGDIVADIDSQSTLTDHIATLKKLGERVAVPAALLEKAVATVIKRIGEVEEKTSVSASPSFKASSLGDSDAFDDIALRNLFEPLLNQKTGFA